MDVVSVIDRIGVRERRDCGQVDRRLQFLFTFAPNPREKLEGHIQPPAPPTQFSQSYFTLCHVRGVTSPFSIAIATFPLLLITRVTLHSHE